MASKRLDETMWVPVHTVQSVSTAESFNATFEKNLIGSSSLSEAYKKTEHIHEQIFGRYRYSNYDSFRRVRERIIKK